MTSKKNEDVLIFTVDILFPESKRRFRLLLINELILNVKKLHIVNYQIQFLVEQVLNSLDKRLWKRWKRFEARAFKDAYLS